MRRAGWIGLMAVAVAAGCGSADVTSGPLATDAPQPVITLAVTTAASGPDASTTSTAPPAATATTAAVPDAARTPDAALAEGFQGAYDAIGPCLGRPAECDPGTVAVPGSPDYEHLRKLAERYASFGYEVRHLPDVSHATIEHTVLGPDGTTAWLTVCEIDGDLVVDPGSTNGFGEDIVVNDEVVARRTTIELRDTPAGWRRWEITLVGEWPMESACAA